MIVYLRDQRALFRSRPCTDESSSGQLQSWRANVCVCRFNSGPGGPMCVCAGLTPVLEGQCVCVQV